MTKGEVAKLLAVLAAAYPKFEVDDVKVQVWHEIFKDVDYEVANVAAKKIILEKTFPPSIAEFREAIISITSPRLMSAAEAWGEVKDAIRRFGYYRESEALASMSPTTARVVRYMGWREICMSEEPAGVLRGQFLKMYEQVGGREQQQRLLPPDLQAEIKKLADKFDLRMIEGGKAG
jgi:hypothetical protein